MNVNAYAPQVNDMRADEAAMRKTARTAGLLYLVIIFAGMFAQFFVRSTLVVPGDAGATAANIMGSEALFRAGIGADLVMVLADVAIGILFYVLLKHVSRTLALLAAFFRLAQAAVLGMNLLNLMFVLELLSGSDALAAFDPAQLQALALPLINMHGTGYAFGLIFFGASIFILGYLLYKSSAFPAILGILLVPASLAYVADGFARVLLTNYAVYQPVFDNVVLTPAFIAEAALCLWLLIKGVRTLQPVGDLALEAAPGD